MEQTHHHKQQHNEKDYVDTSDAWIYTKWRPMMAWMYLTVCMFDFVLFPIGWSFLQAFQHGQIASQWQPLTLQGGGLFHIAMGLILGVTAYGRTREKIAGVAAPGYLNDFFGANAGTTYIPPGQGQANVNNTNQPPYNNRPYTPYNPYRYDPDANGNFVAPPLFGTTQPTNDNKTPSGPPIPPFPEK